VFLKKVVVGCCGFPVARGKYYSLFKVVELQNTFYELPSIEWAEAVRREAPGDFEFTVKAWQVITHPHTSPTWKKMKRKPSGSPENYGYLKPSRENISAFEKTLAVSRALGARIVILQTPSSMPDNEETIKNVDSFFENAKSLVKNEVIGWEIRGPLLSRGELYRVLEKHDVVQVVDLFRARNPFKGSIKLLYTRLHGIGPGEVNYSYNYTDEDLEKLYNMLVEEDYVEAYVMFNNVRMLNNALRFKEIVVEKGGLEIV
jgi:uncharacterized protein YecE (DUF72 family)